MSDQSPSETGSSTTGDTSTGSTSSGNAGSTGSTSSGNAGYGPAAAIDWEKVFNALGGLGHDVVDRFKERASGNAARVREGKYGTNELIEDAEWFWTNFVGDAVRGIDILRAKPPAPSP
jgi:hypothetical protein